MITKSDRKTLKKILGNNYAAAISEKLENEGVKNQQGNFHKAEYIYSVMNGRRLNKDIERAFWQLALKMKNESAKLKFAVKTK